MKKFVGRDAQVAALANLEPGWYAAAVELANLPGKQFLGELVKWDEDVVFYADEAMFEATEMLLFGGMNNNLTPPNVAVVGVGQKLKVPA